MIKFENTEVFGWESAIKGMRNPLESWAKSDSTTDCIVRFDGTYEQDFIGANDLDLMLRLVKAGTEHAKFMRMIHVQTDVTAPLYWWKEMDTYKVGTVANSCSTMHKIHAKEFTLDDFSHEHLIKSVAMSAEESDIKKSSVQMLVSIVNHLNDYRELYLKTKDKDYWWQMIQLLPTSYNQKRTLDLNYANIRQMYQQRKEHKLDEWRVGFCNWVKSLPYSELITEV